MYCEVLSKDLIGQVTGPETEIKVLEEKADDGLTSCVLADADTGKIVISVKVGAIDDGSAESQQRVDDEMEYWGGQDVPVPELAKFGYSRASINRRSSMYLAIASSTNYIGITYNPSQGRRDSAAKDVVKLAKELEKNLSAGESEKASDSTTSMRGIQQPTPTGRSSWLSERMG